MHPIEGLRWRLSFRHEGFDYPCRLAFVSNVCIGNVDPLTILSAVEHRRYETMLPYRKEAFLLGRSAAKMALFETKDGRQLNEIEIRTGVFGFPVANEPSGEQVSITHTKHYAAAIAFPPEHPVAIDLECLYADHFSIVPFLTDGEKRMLNCNVTAITLWSAKESLSKVLRTGFTSPLTLFEVSEVVQKDGYLECTYVNFCQYKTLCFEFANHVFSICGPRFSQLTMEVLSEIRHFLSKSVDRESK